MKNTKFLLILFLFLFLINPGTQVAHSTELDLTTAGSSGTIDEGNAIFKEGSLMSSGSGVFDAFLRISDNTDIVQGYNTGNSIFEDFNQDANDPFTSWLMLTAVPIVNIDGEDYREFVLDINQNQGPGSLISLDALEFYLFDTGNLSDYSSFGTPLWDLPEGDYILLDAALNSSGSGNADMYAYIHDSLFDVAGAGEFVYLFAKFGANNDGFEEWAVRASEGEPINPVPEPGTIFLLASGFIGLAGLYRRKFKGK